MRRVWLLESLQRIVATINQQDDVENSLPQIARTIYEQFGLISVGIGVLEDGWIHYRGVASRVSSLRNRVPLVPPDRGIDPDFPSTHPFDSPSVDVSAMDAIDRSAKLPIRVNGDVYGVLSVAASLDNRLTGEELEVLEQIASVLGTAIEQSRRRNEQVGRLESLNQLQSILSRIQEHADPRDVSDDVLEDVESTFGLLQVQLGSIVNHDLYLYDTFRDARNQSSPSNVIPVRQGIEGRAARSGRPQIVQNAREDPDYLLLEEEAQSIACLPIWSIDEVIGVLRVTSESVANLNDATLEALHMVADRLSLVMANLRRLQDLERRAEQIRTLERVTSAIGRLVPTRAALSDVVREIQQIWGTMSSIGIVMEDRLIFHAPDVEPGSPMHKLTTDGIALGVGVTSRVAMTGVPEFVRDVDADPDYCDVGFDTSTEIVVPIRVNGQVIGVLNVEGSKGRPLDEFDFETLNIVANHIGIALANYDTFSSEQNTRKALEAVQRVSSIVAQTLDPEESLKLIAETLAAVLRYPIVAVEIVDREQLKLAASFGFVAGTFDRQSIDVGVAGRVASTGEIAYLPSLADDPSARRFRDDATSGIYVPIATGETIAGVLTVQGNDEHELTSWDVNLLRTFAEFAGVMLTNSQMFDEMRSSASVDSITGVPNHRYFVERLRKEIQHARREEADLSLLVIDIDAFKEINDRFGHIEGDHVLAEIARRLGSQLRSEDTLARYAGDEFVVILPGVTMRVSLEIAARLLRAVRARPFELTNGETVVVTLSVGAATYPDDATVDEELISAADTAMYLAKGYGRDAVCHFRDVALLDSGESTGEPVVRINP